MELSPKEDHETVYFVSAPFANSGEIASSYIVQGSEHEIGDRVIVLSDDSSIVIDDNTTFVDEDGNPITVNRRDKANGTFEIVIKEETDCKDAPEEIFPKNPQIKSSAEQDESLKLLECQNSPSTTRGKYVDVEPESTIMEHDGEKKDEKNSNIEQASSKDDNFVPTQKPMLILKRKRMSPLKHHADDSMTSQNSSTFKNISIFVDKSKEKAEEEGKVEVNIPDNVEIDKLTCRYCHKTFTKVGNKLRHIRRTHKLKANINSYIRCIECNTNFKYVHNLRDHLQSVHKMNMNHEEMHFPNIDAFQKWKHDTERRDFSSFTVRCNLGKASRGQKYYYMCHRSGKYERMKNKPMQRMPKTSGTCKLGIMCTAAIYCDERPTEVFVKYFSHHYGHGKESSFVQLSTMEQDAIQENISNGIPFEKLLNNIRDGTVSDKFQMRLVKKNDIKYINKAFNAEEYNPGLSDAESVDRWVRLCYQMEDCPVLYYKQEENFDKEGQFMLIMMTEFQKHILLSSDKQTVCVDSLYRRKGGRFYLTCLFVLDECEVAFPVAFCISNKVNKRVIKQFLTSIRDVTGPLSYEFFMSDSERFYHEAWVEVMNDESKWLWCLWFVDFGFRSKLKVFKGNVAKRAVAYKTMRMLLECQNANVFETMFKNYIETLQNDPLSMNLGNFILQQYGNTKQLWAYCYHKEIKMSTIIQLEVLHHTLRYCCREGRKKRLDKFIYVIMKLVRHKMLDRLANILDDEKVSLAIEAINMCHNIGLDIPSDCISSLSNKIWLIKSEEEEDNVYIIREFDTCPEHCTLKCSECDICVHMYSCSCMHNMINANLCQHIHAVVWKFLTPHFSPMNSPAHSDTEEIENIDITAIPSQSSELFDSVLKRTHDVFKKVRSNKCTLNKDLLTAVMKRLNECVDMISSKVVKEDKPDPPNKNSMFVINPCGPYMRSPPSQPLILPNQLPTMLPQNGPLSQYVLLLPNNANPLIMAKKISH